MDSDFDRTLVNEQEAYRSCSLTSERTRCEQEIRRPHAEGRMQDVIRRSVAYSDAIARTDASDDELLAPYWWLAQAHASSIVSKQADVGGSPTCVSNGNVLACPTQWWPLVCAPIPEANAKKKAVRKTMSPTICFVCWGRLSRTMLSSFHPC